MGKNILKKNCNLIIFFCSPGRGFFVPGFENAAGHKMMSVSELMDASRGVTNMYLAHEIAVDKVIFFL